MKSTKKLWSSLACAASLAVPASAFAIDTRQQYSASIDVGGAVPVGEILFDFDQEVPGNLGNPGACGYLIEWVNAATLPLSSQCYLAEQRTHGHVSCLVNALTNFSTFLTDAGSSECDGFTPFQQLTMVSALILGETPSGELTGTVQFAGPFPTVYSIDVVSRQAQSRARARAWIKAEAQTSGELGSRILLEHRR